MPFFESVDELADSIADMLGVYGAHSKNEECSDSARKMCRVCFVSVMSSRIRGSVENERLLEEVGRSR